MRRGPESAATEFVIGTEIGHVDRLRVLFPHKRFYPLRLDAICIQMKKNTLYNLYLALKDETNVVQIPPPIADQARQAIQRMLELSR